MPPTAHKPTYDPTRIRARDRMLSLRPVDNRTIRLLAAHLNLSLRDTVHQIVTHYLSSHDIDLGRIFEDPKIMSDQQLDKL